ncbi:MAG: UDP-glucose 4-epimerase GalE [Acidimicrobiaceae bacterium]|nr:UDP-glucose 4-epimerase GalE [Acidimicrobiaceae bacterium]MXW62663.1 UDP-glucose 4-epimerase GalE [Acidimicrobiaceae bacterium]MXW74793.1 UDP-glucose 4-epimerase GalE [Acidimicrobiaceae bacterium]MYA73422.1 UDP-glucose 4-epimerase GalE [Acidimicrobiaceae bacterium]MYC42014.1 UDP-glucose 4-epimerase GalE [Acidimicrobiaceae bacterium]
MAVLVTGGAGYIGSHTAVALHEAGHDVVIVDNFANSSPRAVDAVRTLTAGELAFVEADLLDDGAVRGVFERYEISEVVHFAAHKAVAESVQEPSRYYRNNLGSLLGVLEAMLEHGVDKLVHSSSCTVYGQPAVLPVTESAPVGATSPYGWTKLMSEQIISDVCAVRPLAAIMLRYFNPVGAHGSGTLGEDPNDIPNNLVPLVMQVAGGRRERLPVFGDDYDTADGSGVRDYVHVVDLAEAHVAALEVLMAGHDGATAVNVGTGSGTSVLELIEAARRATDRPIPYEIVERRPGDIAKTWAATDLAREFLGWQAKRDIDDMMRDHWRWHSRHPDGYGRPDGRGR